MAASGALLLGRRTWQDLRAAWSGATDGNPFTAHLDAAAKFVASTTLADADAWSNSTLLPGDAAVTVAELKARPGPDLTVIGSAALVRSLHAARLVDRYTLLLHPLTLGSGARLFETGLPRTELELVSCVPTTRGVIIAEYVRA